jgi:hypothetical protein
MMADTRAPLDIKSYSEAFVLGKLDKVEAAELRDALSSEDWKELVQLKYEAAQHFKLQGIKAKNREQIDLSDVVNLLIMILERP